MMGNERLTTAQMKDWLINEQIEMAVVLDKREERILIGRPIDIELVLCGEENENPILFDQKRPLGTLLLDFRKDDERTWFYVASYFRDILEAKKNLLYGEWISEHIVPEVLKTLASKTKNNKFKSLKAVYSFLEEKYQSDNPVDMFIAIQIYSEFELMLRANVANQEENRAMVGEFKDFYRALLQPLYDEKDRIWQENEEVTRENTFWGPTVHRPSSNMRALICYAADERKSEYAMSMGSLLGIKEYYVREMEEAKTTITICDVCKKPFLVKNKRQTLCCEACRKIHAKEIRDQQTALQKELERISNKANRFWDYHTGKLSKEVGIDEKLVEEAERVKKKFRKEFSDQKKKLKQQKKAGKSEEVLLEELDAWIERQKRSFDLILDQVQ